MNWSEFITNIENGLLGRRFSDLELSNETNIGREIIYKLRTGITIKPQQSSISKLESGLNIKIDNSDINNITYIKQYEKTEKNIIDFEYVRKLEDENRKLKKRLDLIRSEFIEIVDKHL